MSPEEMSKTPSAAAKPPFRNILVPLDGSSESESIFQHVIPLALQFHSKVTLVEVLTTPQALLMETAPGDLGGSLVIDPTPILDAEKEQADTYLQQAAGRLRNAGLDVDVRDPQGAPGAIIFDVARDLGADLIAMATHARSGLGRLIFGNLSDEVLQATPCPVLLTRIGPGSGAPATG
ncbi:MAG TPA: universal stress protein [Chloroflexota bacterium]